MFSPTARALLQARHHRPYPIPQSPWLGRQWWGSVLFAHWPVPAATLQRLLPGHLRVEQHGGSAWIGLVAFRIRMWPRAMPWAGQTFAEVNLRTYVDDGSRPGVWFFSLDATSRLAVRAARLLLNLPYNEAAADVRQDAQGTLACSSTRGSDGAAMTGRFYAAGPVQIARAGSLEHFLTERYCLYGVHRALGPYRLDIHHRPWLLQPASGAFDRNTLLDRLPVDVKHPPVLHVGGDQHVLTWGPVPLGVSETARAVALDASRTEVQASALQMAAM